jgi:carboxyl-terminal processing protease
MSRKPLVLAALLPLSLLALAAASAPATSPVPAGAIKPTDVQAASAKMVYGILSDAHYAYRPRNLDDRLSAEIFRRYLESLDPQKLYFTQADINRFTPYRTTLDDSIKAQNLIAPYDMFGTYAKRVDQRVAHARSVIAKPMDFSVKEDFAYDREDAAWAANEAELNEIWRKNVKNDALRLRLAGRPADEIRKTLDKRYATLGQRVHELRGDDVFEIFMNSYATSIDPHTSYMSPRSAENFNMQMRLSLEGIGAVLQRQDEYVVIRTIVPGGPADLSDRIKVGDRVVAVGQGDTGPMVDVIDWRIDDVVDKIRGKKGTKVRLDILPVDANEDGKHTLLTIVRDKIKLEEQAASKRIIDVQGKRIGVVELPGFYLDFEALNRGDPDVRSATTDVNRLLAELRAEHVDGVVMDLRDNGGGSLQEAVELTGLFIDRGPVVQVKESGGKVSVDSDDQRGVAWDGPLAVLVNRSSASASEIFAAAIQDYGRGLIIGEPTFGKGTVQNLINLDRWPTKTGPQFGQVKLTIAQFFRVDGGTTQHAGVVPEVQFPVSVDASEFGESTYDNALPASRIAVAPHANLGNFSPIVPRLVALHDARVAKDKEYSWLAQDVARFRAERAKKTISLNEAERRAERDKAEARRLQRESERKAMGLAANDAYDDDGLQVDERDVTEQIQQEEAAKKRPDPLLRESAAILADAINVLTGNRELTMQVLPRSKQPTHWSD